MLSTLARQRGIKLTIDPLSKNTVVGQNFVVWELAGGWALNNKPYMRVALVPDAPFMLWYCERWVVW